MGRVVVVVGGSVVVVVVGGMVDGAPELGSTTVVVEVGGTVVVEDVLVVGEDGLVGGTSGVGVFAEPGCSRATTPPISAAPPVAAMTTV